MPICDSSLRVLRSNNKTTTSFFTTRNVASKNHHDILHTRATAKHLKTLQYSSEWATSLRLPLPMILYQLRGVTRNRGVRGAESLQLVVSKCQNLRRLSSSTKLKKNIYRVI